MTTRNIGIYDGGLIGRIIGSSQSPKALSFFVSGVNPSVNSSLEDIWALGGDYPIITTPDVLTLSSTDAQDAPAGTGIASVVATGLDVNYQRINEIITLNGTMPVTSTQEFFRLFSVDAFVPNAPNPLASFAGDITVLIDAATVAFINAGETASHMSVFTVPVGYTGFIDQIWLSGGNTGKSFTVEALSRKENNVFVSSAPLIAPGGNFSSINFTASQSAIAEKSDVKMRAKHNGGPGIIVAATFEFTIIRNDYLQSLIDSI